MSTPRLTFSHLELYVRDLERMLAFYTGILGFVVTDQGGSGRQRMAFLSQDPHEHHQLVLTSGRANQADEADAAPLDHLSFRLEGLSALRGLHAQLLAAGVEGIECANHGISWSVYFRDPEGTRLECFADTPWHLPQPYREALDFALPDEEIVRHTEALCRSAAGFQEREHWRAGFVATLEV